MFAIAIPVIYFGGSYFSIFVGVISIIALKELTDLKLSHNKIPEIVFLLAAICLLLLIFSDYEGYSIMYGLSYRGIALSIIAMLIPCIFSKKYETKDAIFMIGAIIILGLSMNGAILIRKFSLEKFIYIISIPIVTDSFALFIGNAFGKHKLSKISPNKSWEGCFGGSLFAVIISNAIYYFMVSSVVSWQIILITLTLSILGQMGDLIFSRIKRENNIKDFSSIIPGHGGILDRIDSLIIVMATAIIFFSQI